MTVDETRFMPQNAEPADAQTSTGPKLNQPAAGAALGWGTSETLVSAHRHSRVNGAVPCAIQTFTNDRQRLMRSWLAMQGQAPAHIIADELVSTISALRQLVELRE
jgi:hypothetical protein